MERIELTDEERRLMAEQVAYMESQGITPPEPLVPRTNIVIGDDLRVCDAFDAHVFSGEGGLPWVVAFGGVFPLDCADYVTDRAGPNGETMPVLLSGEEPDL